MILILINKLFTTLKPALMEINRKMKLLCKSLKNKLKHEGKCLSYSESFKNSI